MLRLFPKPSKTFLLFSLLLLATATPASAKNEPKVQRVYIFGFSASFTDSLACLTSVQQLDSAWIDPSHGFLMDRALYSLQLQYHVENGYGVSETTCAVFFYKSKSKADEERHRILRRYSRNKNVKLKEITSEQFQFKAEDYRQNAPVHIETESQEQAADAQAAPDRPDNKGKRSKKDRKSKKDKGK